MKIKSEVKDYQKLLFNEKGSILISTLLIIFSFFLCSIILIKLEIVRIDKLDKTYKAYLCTKEYNFLLGNHIQSIEYFNKVIMTGKGLELIGYIIPIFKAAGKNIKRAAQIAQELRSHQFRLTLLNLLKKPCLFDPQVIKTPYKFNAKHLRDSIGRAQLRSHKWQHFSGFSSVFLKTTNIMENTKLSQRTYEFNAKGALSLLNY